ncbi:NUDIX domain-containing protein [Streptomyces sp. NBC_01727]|uniref:NUDIX domain-containing protein n=1 Tax=Streptomyces sp. NBC_01727 TaxID=2975924 RepID=UPI003FA3B3F7
MAGAGAIIHDAARRILLVQPSYRTDTWEIPGGGLEVGERTRCKQSSARSRRSSSER